MALKVMQQTSSWRMGWRDYWCGYNPKDNPYPGDTVMNAQWANGWRTAKFTDDADVIAQLPREGSPAAKGFDL